jgi:hypothetical protein
MGRYWNGLTQAAFPWLIITPDLWIGTGGLLGSVYKSIEA